MHGAARRIRRVHPFARLIVAACGAIASPCRSCASADSTQGRASIPSSSPRARTPQPIAELLADVTVIGADEIARSGAQSLTELLQRQPGVEITMNGGPGSTSGVFLRGANPARRWC